MHLCNTFELRDKKGIQSCHSETCELLARPFERIVYLLGNPNNEYDFFLGENLGELQSLERQGANHRRHEQRFRMISASEIIHDGI